MKKIIFIFVAMLSAPIFKAQAQDDRENRRVITTGVPFLAIAADPRAAGTGDQGVATTADAYSQQWNPSKYAFALKQQGVGVTFTPYLSNLVNDIFLGNLTYYNKFNERSALAASFRYFSLGEIEFRETADQEPLIQQPNEFTFDVSYALKLSENFSMSVAGRYLRSDLKIAVDGVDASSAGSFGVDISGYYQSEQKPMGNFDGRWRGGFNFSNIGGKIKYDDAGQENFIPTNMRLGGGFDFILDEYNKISTSLELSKLLVPTPLDPDSTDNGGNGDGAISDEERVSAQNQYNDIGAFAGIFKSFGDAPDGFGEEIKEFTWSLGAEYVYQDAFSLRAGYFNESEEKGARKFLTLGAGFKYTIVNIDISYLFSTSKVRSPLENTLRFGLSFNFGDDYQEY